MTQLASDDFNRADAPNLGANWDSPNLVITSGEAAVSPLLASNAYTAVAAPNDGYAEVVGGSVLETLDGQWRRSHVPRHQHG
jgi:hypothetical protein